MCVCVFGGAARYGLRRSGASAVIHVIKILQDQLKICMEMNASDISGYGLSKGRLLWAYALKLVSLSSSMQHDAYF